VPSRDARSGELRRPLEALLGVPFTEGNEVQVLRNGVETFPAMLAAIGAATRSVDLLTFVWNTGWITRDMTAALADRARSGVRVRVLLDSFGALHIDRAQLREMRAAGCDVAFHRPLLTWRGVDGEPPHAPAGPGLRRAGGPHRRGRDRPAWSGDAEGPDRWRDTSVLVRGPAVAGLRAAFARSWLQTSRPLLTDADRFPPAQRAGGCAVQVLRSSSGPGWNEAALAVLGLVSLARRRIRITTPYVRLTARFHELLAAAVARDVQVQLLTVGPVPDRPTIQLQSRRQYQRLLDSGVELWRYQPTVVHAKVFTVDGRLSMVGTANLDQRSLTLNEQVGLVVDDAAVTAVLDAQFDDDLESSRPVLAQEWRARGARERALEIGADLVGRPLRGFGSAGLTSRRPRSTNAAPLRPWSARPTPTASGR
jgi:cardiolipin synthase A/B